MKSRSRFLFTAAIMAGAIRSSAIAGDLDLTGAAEAQPSKPAGPATETGGSDSADLAMKLANPVSSLISVPFQANWDFGIGLNDATRFTLNIQPVIPISLTDDLNLIVRTIFYP